MRRNQLQHATKGSFARNKKLAKTLFIVTILSLITWLPTGFSLASPSYLRDASSLYVQITLTLQFANSFLNPIVYCFRMTEFKMSLKKLFCRYYSRKPVCDDVPLSVSKRISLTYFKSVADMDTTVRITSRYEPGDKRRLDGPLNLNVDLLQKSL